MKFQEARDSLEEKRSACFRHAMRASDGWAEGVMLILEKGVLTQYLWNSRTKSWDNVGPVENIGMDTTLESAEWDVDMLSAFE